MSIGRRLLDPLAEFVKIDPKHVGVGQYQVSIKNILIKPCVLGCNNYIVSINSACWEIFQKIFFRIIILMTNRSDPD